MKSLRMIHPVQRTVQAIRFLCLRSSFCTPTAYSKALHKIALVCPEQVIKPQHLFRLPLRFCTISHNTTPAKKLFHIGTAFRYLVHSFGCRIRITFPFTLFFRCFPNFSKHELGSNWGQKIMARIPSVHETWKNRLNLTI